MQKLRDRVLPPAVATPVRFKVESDDDYAERVRESQSEIVLKPVAAGETREAYSARVEDALVADWTASINKASSLMGAAEFRGRAAAVVTAAAKYHAVNGRWPEKLSMLMPEFIAQLPADPFTGGEVHYIAGKEGVRVYSFGANGRDDGGVDDPHVKADDVGCGVVDGAMP